MVAKAKQYVVSGACALVKVDTTDGPQVRMFYKDAVLPPSVSDETIAHLVDVQLIEEIKGADEPVGDQGQVPAAQPAPTPAP